MQDRRSHRCVHVWRVHATRHVGMHVLELRMVWCTKVTLDVVRHHLLCGRDCMMILRRRLLLSEDCGAVCLWHWHVRRWTVPRHVALRLKVRSLIHQRT